MVNRLTSYEPPGVGSPGVITLSATDLHTNVARAFAAGTCHVLGACRDHDECIDLGFQNDVVTSASTRRRLHERAVRHHEVVGKQVPRLGREAEVDAQTAQRRV